MISLMGLIRNSDEVRKKKEMDVTRGGKREEGEDISLFDMSNLWTIYDAGIANNVLKCVYVLSARTAFSHALQEKFKFL